MFRCDWEGPLLCKPWFHWRGSEYGALPGVFDPPSVAVDQDQDASNSCQVSLHIQPEGSVEGLARNAQYQRWGGQLGPGEKTGFDNLMSKWYMVNMTRVLQERRYIHRVFTGMIEKYKKF